MKIRFLVIATALALASTPGLADWAKLKEAASELGTAVSDTSKEAWKGITDFSKETVFHNFTFYLFGSSGFFYSFNRF